MSKVHLRNNTGQLLELHLSGEVKLLAPFGDLEVNEADSRSDQIRYLAQSNRISSRPVGEAAAPPSGPVQAPPKAKKQKKRK
jgi:hypothetical protein